MKSTLTKEQYKRIYDLLNSCELLDYDCGKLCNAACCTVSREYSEDDMGIYLLPGEEQLLEEEDKEWLDIRVSQAEDHDLPESWKGDVYFIRCKTPPICPREKRPIQCRTFPLAPHIDSEGELTLIYNDLELPYECPLIEEEIPLNDDFVDKTLEAWEILIEDPLIYDLVKLDSEERESSFTELMDKLGI